MDVDGLIVGLLFTISVDSNTDTSELASAMVKLSVSLWNLSWKVSIKPHFWEHGCIKGFH